MAPDQDLDLLAELKDPTPEQEAIQTILDDLADLAPEPATTHSFECWRWHVGCLAKRIRAHLSPE